jgi:tripeptide aminopeptidase
MFTAHMDTVPDAVGAVPRLDSEKRRIVNDAAGKALGGDNRTGCAVLLQVARELCRRFGNHAPTTLVFFVQEEVGLVGSRGLEVALLGPTLPSECVNVDSSRVDEIITAVIGTKRFTIDIAGIAAHAGAHPEDGVSAAMIAATALAELHRDGWHGAIEKSAAQCSHHAPRDELHHVERDGCTATGSANVGIIRGGTGSNVVMPEMHLLAEARAHDPAFREAIIAAWHGAFERAAAAQPNCRGQRGSLRFGPGPAYEAFDLPADAPVVRSVLAAAARCGIDARCVSNNGGMDANWTVARGIPTVTIGAGQRHVHTPSEHIDLADFEHACRLAVELATQAN